MNGSYSTSVCADCGTQDPSWASINRGVLLCNDCCSVHRSLGRHISHVRSLQAPNWPPVLKETVFTLVKKGSNSLWEHLLHETSHHQKIKVKKPSPRDSRDKNNVNRHDFIVCKYKNLQFLPRLSIKDHINSLEDLSKQLHASVRTNNLETCLRLISLGADPNYKHVERGNTPLHVAAQAGQAMQVELLVVHGANPSLLDRLGHTPEECARIAGHHQLADRLIECQYELTDKLSFYLSGRTPVHSIGEHFLVPQGAGSAAGMSEARKRLQEISNELFEELAADVYDEVDRRETDAMWITTQQLQSCVAFLPVNPTLSPLRNQSRQKLALLNSSEFTQLLVDILLDAKRRQQLSMETGQTSGTVVPSTSDDKTAVFDPHDYDEVPIDETKSPTNTSPPNLKPEILKKLPKPPSPYKKSMGGRPKAPTPYKSSGSFVPGPSLHNDVYSIVREEDMEEERGGGDYEELSDPPKRELPPDKEDEGPVSRSKFNMVVERLKKITVEKEELEIAKIELEERVSTLQSQLNKLVEENSRLRSSTSRTPPPPSSPTTLTPIMEPSTEAEENEESPSHIYAKVDYSKKTSRVFSSIRLSGHDQLPSPTESQTTPTERQTTPTEQQIAPVERQLAPIEKQIRPIESQATPTDFQTMPTDRQATTPTDRQTSPTEERILKKSKSSSSDVASIVTPPPPRQDTPLSDSAFEEPSTEVVLTNPPVEVIHSHIKTLTQIIQDLLKAAQSHNQTHFYPCSVKIGRAVDTLFRIFPAKPSSQEIQVSLQEVKNASQRLQTECQDGSQSDLAYRTRQIISSAYDVAKAARHLVMCVEQDSKRE